MQENKVIDFENKPDGTGSFKAIPAYHTFSSWEGAAACLHILISTRSIIPSDIGINLYWCVILLSSMSVCVALIWCQLVNEMINSPGAGISSKNQANYN